MGTEITNTRREVVPLPEKFFCDGPYYLITSSSIGGLSPEELAAKVSGSEVEEVIKNAVGIPIAFQGDCAMDNAIVVMGDLSAQEEAEWIGRISWKLDIPCGKLLLICGGGDSESIEGAVSGKGLGGFKDYFQQIELTPGKYLTEVYAYLPSVTGNFFLESDSPMAEWQSWFKQDRKGEELPEWLQEFDEYSVPGELEELVSYIIRVTPLTKEPTKLPDLDEDIGWCTFEMRKPKQCPSGILRSALLSQ